MASPANRGPGVPTRSLFILASARPTKMRRERPGPGEIPGTGLVFCGPSETKRPPATTKCLGEFDPPERRMPDWQEILTRDGRAVWQAAYRVLGNRADADECFQEAFLAALEFSRRKDVRNWRALLQRVVTARAVDRLRRRRRQAARQEPAHWEGLPGHAPTPLQNAED